MLNCRRGFNSFLRGENLFYLMFQLNEFVFGWRGFLIGSRRNWHAHHRWGVTGFRGGTLVAREATQTDQLRRCAGLLTDVFSRGGTIWSFGMGHRADPPWGRVRPAWRPGVLSNCFFSRLRKTHFVRRLTRVFYVRRLRRKNELTTRWVRLRERGGLPRPGVDARVVSFTRSLRRLVQGSSFPDLAPTKSPAAARRRTRWFRTWWTTAATFSHPRVGVHLRAISARAVYPLAARVVRHAVATRRGRPRGNPRRWRRGLSRPTVPEVSPGEAVPHRGVNQHQRWPVAFPSVVMAGGLTLLKTTLLNEVDSAGLLFVRFGGVDFVPRATLFEVYWNPRATAAAGVPAWTTDLFVRAARAGLFRTCWRRLTRLAER